MIMTMKINININIINICQWNDKYQCGKYQCENDVSNNRKWKW